MRRWQIDMLAILARSAFPHLRTTSPDDPQSCKAKQPRAKRLLKQPGGCLLLAPTAAAATSAAQRDPCSAQSQKHVGASTHNRPNAANHTLGVRADIVGIEQPLGKPPRHITKQADRNQAKNDPAKRQLQKAGQRIRGPFGIAAAPHRRSQSQPAEQKVNDAACRIAASCQGLEMVVHGSGPRSAKQRAAIELVPPSSFLPARTWRSRRSRCCRRPRAPESPCDWRPQRR